MKVVLTGATGFLGSNFVRVLSESNLDLVILKRSFSDVSKIEKYSKQYRAYDIDKISLDEIFNKEDEIDVIIHCATVYRRQNEPLKKLIDANLVFPLELIDVAAKSKIKAFFNTDTFSNTKEQIVDLNDNGYLQSYSLSKYQFVQWGKMYSAIEKIKFVNMKLEHVYGPNDNKGKFIPFVLNGCMENVEGLDLTEGMHQRDFIYVDDVISAYLTVLENLEHLKHFEEFEVGCAKTITVKTMVQKIKELTQSKTQLNFGAIDYRNNEIHCSKANTDKLKNFGWRPKYGYDEGILECIKQYKAQTK